MWTNKTINIQQGDTFSIVFQYKEEGNAMELPAGYDLIVGIYDSVGELLKSARLSDGSITINKNGTYSMPISHEECMSMIGQVTIELTIADDKRDVVDHASDVVIMTIKPRRNNDLL